MQDARELTWFTGLDLSEFGMNSAGQPIFRVILASTRVQKFETLEGERKEMLAYPFEGWVLERWKSAYEFAGTPEQFAAACLSAGHFEPYPNGGEYFALYNFKTNEEVAFAPSLCRFSLNASSLSIAEIKAMQAFREEQKQKEVTRKRREMIADAAPTKVNGYAGGGRMGLAAESFKFYNEDGKEVIQ